MTISMATAQTDFYKMFHREGYHVDISKVYSNYTSRNGKLSNVKDNEEVVFVGLQYFIKDVLIREWNETFFDLPKCRAIKDLKRIVENSLGFDYDTSHFEALHDLGYLPLKIKALPEGVSVPYGVPPVTFVNTVDGFQWLSNFIETVFSTENWIIQTSATTAKEYLKNTIKAFDNAGLSHDLVPYMCHDFSMRGMAGRHAAAMSGFGHLTSFAGTDTIPAILFAEKYYNADVEREMVGCSVPATEHSTATSYILLNAKQHGMTKLEAEVDYVRYLMDKVPTGILSHVSDSFDFWNFVEKGLPQLKDDILCRDGKLVIRPDSGDPVEVLCGKDSFYKTVGNTYTSLDSWKRAVEMDVFSQSNDEYLKNSPNFDFERTSIYTGSYGTYEITYKIALKRTADEKLYYTHPYDFVYEKHEQTAEDKGLIQCLWEIFGGTLSPNGYKVLDEHIGAIYGDSITLERQKEIIERLEAKGFAVKATWVECNGEGQEVFKDPKTDSKKKSAKGLLQVLKENGKYVVKDQVSKEEEDLGELSTVFLNGKLVKETSLSEIRENVKKSLY